MDQQEMLEHLEPQEYMDQQEMLEHLELAEPKE